MSLSFKRAEDLRFALTVEQQHEIRKLYQGVADDVERELNKPLRVPSDAARREYLRGLQGQINEALADVGRSTDSIIRANALSVAESIVGCNSEWLGSVGLSMAGAYSWVPQDVVTAVATGQIYDGNWSLSGAIWSDVHNQQSDIQRIIAQGIAENKSAFDIGKDLERYVDPSSAKPWDWSKVYPGVRRQIDYNAQRLARTMVSHAYQQAFVQTTQKNPFVTKYRWDSSNSDRTCELCADRDGKLFEKDSLPMDHPNGMCTFVAIIDDMTDVANRLADWAQGKADPELDEWSKDLYGNNWEDKVYKSEPLIPGKNDPEITDSIRDYYLPQQVRDNLASIESLNSYNDFVEYFKGQGITLDTALEPLKTTRQNDDIPAVKELCQKLATGVDTYKTMFGEDSLSKLTRIVLYDQNEDSTAAYYFNRIGENDPLAGTIRFSNWQADGRAVFHELAHAFQDSKARKGEDAVSFSARMVSEAHLDPKFSAYFGAAQDVIEAERFADAFGFGFSQGSKSGMEFIDNVRRALF